MYQRQLFYNNLQNKLQNDVDEFCSNRPIADLKLIIIQVEKKIQKQYNFIQNELLANRLDNRLKEIMSLKQQIININSFYNNYTNNILSSPEDFNFLHLNKFITGNNIKYNHDIEKMIKILNIHDETSSTHIQHQYKNFINNYHNQLKAKLDIMKSNTDYHLYEKFNKIKQYLLSPEFTKNVSNFIYDIYTATSKPELEAYVSQLNHDDKKKREKLARKHSKILFALINDDYEEIKKILNTKNNTKMIKLLKNFKQDCEDMCEKIRSIKENYNDNNYGNFYKHNTRKNNNRFSDIGNNLIYGIGNIK